MSWDAISIGEVVQAARGTTASTHLSSTAISGAFSVAVSPQNVFVQVTLTTIPATQGRRPGNPSWYYGLGWVNWNVSGVVIDWANLNFAVQYWWPRWRHGNAVAGFLADGVSGTLDIYTSSVP